MSGTDDNPPTEEPTRLGIVERLRGAATVRSGATDEAPDPQPWDDATGVPHSGEEGIGAGTFGYDHATSDHYDPYGAPQTVGVPERPVWVRESQADSWGARQVTVVGGGAARRVAEANPRRRRLVVSTVDDTNTVALGPSQAAASGSDAVTLSDAAPLELLSTGEVWAYAAVTIVISVVSEQHSGLAAGLVADLDGI